MNESEARILESMQARGVDLSMVAARARNKHRWTLHTYFNVDEAVVARLHVRRAQVANLIAKGEQEDSVVPAVPLNMNTENLFHMDGPGCIKCGAHWEDLERGQGHGCPVTDDQYEAQFAQGLQQRDQFLGAIFQKLVADAQEA